MNGYKIKHRSIHSFIYLSFISLFIHPDALLWQKFLPACLFPGQNSTLLAFYPVKIPPYLHFPRSKLCCFYTNIFPPWICFSFKNSFLVFIFIFKASFSSLLFYFTFFFSLTAFPIQFYQTISCKSLNVMSLT